MNTELQTITLRTQIMYGELVTRFFESYTLLSVVDTWDNRKVLKKRKDRLCRFCGKNSSETTFRKDAHLIPNFLGNQYFLSDFECDNCNAIFSSYENHFAALVGAERTINKVKGKAGVPKFKSPAKALEIKAEDFYNKESVQITRPSTDNSTFSFDKETSTFKVAFQRNSYIPNAAYKCLLKIALSVLPEDTLDKYGTLKRYLVNPNFGKLEGCPVIKYSLPFGIQFPPHAMLFQKKNATEETMTHMLSFFCLNYIFWIPITLHSDDLSFYSKPIDLKIPPPLFAQEGDLEQLQISRIRESWNSIELKKGETQEFTINMSKADLDNGVAIDPKTGEQRKHVLNHEDIVSLILYKDDGTPLNLNHKL